jgi:hypothetical protein
VESVDVFVELYLEERLNDKLDVGSRVSPSEEIEYQKQQEQEFGFSPSE